MSGGMSTRRGPAIGRTMVGGYMRDLVNKFFKILPMRESHETSMLVYMESLQMELLGCSELIEAIHNDRRFLSLISVLEYLIGHANDPVRVFKREVFKCIRICNELSDEYTGRGVDD